VPEAAAGRYLTSAELARTGFSGSVPLVSSTMLEHLWFTVTFACISRQTLRSIRLSSGQYGGRKCIRNFCPNSSSHSRVWRLQGRARPPLGSAGQGVRRVGRRRLGVAVGRLPARQGPARGDLSATPGGPAFGLAACWLEGIFQATQREMSIRLRAGSCRRRHTDAPLPLTTNRGQQAAHLHCAGQVDSHRMGAVEMRTRAAGRAR
jgi:hypothetical protein